MMHGQRNIKFRY